MNKDINNIANLLHVHGRTFDQLKERMMEVTVPASILDIGQSSNGSFYAIMQLDRPAIKKPRAKKSADVVVDNSIKV